MTNFYISLTQLTTGLSRSLLILVLCGNATTVAGQFIVAHRGASFDAPENTLAAFRLAWEQGADGIEGDFYVSTDGRLVCIHDEDTERVSGEKLQVSESTFTELRGLDVGSWKGPQWKQERIPSLEEVLATVPRGKMMFIELKTGPEIVKPLEQVLAVSTVPLKYIIIISFEEETIAECERRMPEMKSYFLTTFKQRKDNSWRPTAKEVVETMHRIKADGLGAKAVTEHFDSKFLSQLRKGGINDFHVWTVDDPFIAAFYKKHGAWSITSNQPQTLRESLAL